MSKILIIVLLIFINNMVNAQLPKTRILLIGNSLTQYKKNKMPDILQSMLDENEKNIEITTFVMNGQSLYGFTHIKFLDKPNGFFRKNRGYTISGNDTTLPTVYQKIMNGNYDIVVLQERGNSILSYDYRKYEYYPSVKSLDSVINLSKAKTFIYESYPSFSNDSIKVCPSSFFHKMQCSEVYNTLDQQYDTIEKSNEYVLNKINNEIFFIPIGYVSLKFKKLFPEIELVNKTGHPTKIFQYLISSVFYVALTNEQPKFYMQNNIDYKLKSKIREIVWSSYIEHINR